ncbi:MAG: DUF1592 domain-containing protein [Polyangiaceae bacterium]
MPLSAPAPSRPVGTFLAREALACVLTLASTTAACSGSARNPAGDEPGNHPAEVAAAAPYEPAGAVLPRLTTLQYQSSLRDLLGPDVPLLRTEADTNPYLFDSIGAASTTLSELGAEQYELSAEAVTQHVFSDPARRAALLGCQPARPGDPCVRDYLSRFGRRAFRRPLTGAELARWTDVSIALAEPDLWEGVRLATAGMLQSPYFLYRVELGLPDPEHPSRRVLTDHEMASRLSFFLWNTLPDEALLDAADAGELHDESSIYHHAVRLLSDDRARDAIQRYFAQYLDLGRLEGIQRDPETYPLFTPSMKSAMRREVELLVDHVVQEGGDARAIFSTRESFVSSELASLYGIDAPGATESTFVRATLPEERAGLLTLGAFLTMNAHETETSPTARGKYVRERVLCQEVEPPPPDVSTTLEPASGDAPATLRERLEEHRKNPACAGCHSFIDPPGLLFEHFDSIGAYREHYPGPLAIDATGDLDGVPLDGARDLADLLASDPRVGRCMVRQLFRHAHARRDEKGERPAIDDLTASFAAKGYDFRDLLLQLVTHESFRTLRADPNEVSP